MRFSFDDERYDRAGEGKCWEMFHEELRGHSPYCGLDADHGGLHKGHGLLWEKQPDVPIENVKKFLAYYRRIPNSGHDITLRDDGRVEMSLRGFQAATLFINVRDSGD